MKRVSPSERTRQTIAELLEQGTAEKDPLNELIRLSVQSVVEVDAIIGLERPECDS